MFTMDKSISEIGQVPLSTANCADPDQTGPWEQCDLDLLCFIKHTVKNSGQIW